MVDGRILVVDDDADLRATLAILLREDGYRVDEAANGREALEHLRTTPPPDLILLDMMMPELNGQEFRAAQLGDPRLAAIPVALMTAGRVGKSIDALFPAAVIRKPVALRELLDAVARLVGR